MAPLLMAIVVLEDNEPAEVPVPSWSVPAEIVVTEEAAKSTRESALYVARLLSGEAGSKVLMTSDYHMFRAVRTFRKAGIEVSPRPIPDALKRYGTYSKVWSAFLDEASESVKIVYYACRGWI